MREIWWALVLVSKQYREHAFRKPPSTTMDGGWIKGSFDPWQRSLFVPPVSSANTKEKGPLLAGKLFYSITGKLFYSSITSCIQNNGWSSDFFQLGRGVRQGCPLSPYLFILCVEILASAIRNNDGIKGICISDSECKLSQYADDTTLILDGSDNSVNTSLKLLDSFAELSGLNVNYEKTEALWIGSFRLQTRTIETGNDFSIMQG